MQASNDLMENKKKKRGLIDTVKDWFVPKEADMDEQTGMERPSGYGKKESLASKIADYALPAMLSYGSGQGIIPGIADAYFGRKKLAREDKRGYTKQRSTMMENLRKEQIQKEENRKDRALRREGIYAPITDKAKGRAEDRTEAELDRELDRENILEGKRNRQLKREKQQSDTELRREDILEGKRDRQGRKEIALTNKPRSADQILAEKIKLKGIPSLSQYSKMKPEGFLQKFIGVGGPSIEDITEDYKKEYGPKKRKGETREQFTRRTGQKVY